MIKLVALTTLLWASSSVSAFVPQTTSSVVGVTTTTPSCAAAAAAAGGVPTSRNTRLFVSIGLGPGDTKDEVDDDPSPASINYVTPIHEDYRLSRRSNIDKDCDDWFESLLNTNKEESGGILGELSINARKRLLEKVELTNDIMKDYDDEEWTPYVNTKLPWTPLTPAYGLEQFGLPIVRRNAETWRHFDVMGMVQQDYSLAVDQSGTELVLNEEEIALYKQKLVDAGGWLEDDACSGRLIYVNGRFVPALSKTTDIACNLGSLEDIPTADDNNNNADYVKDCLARLTDGFTDTLAAPVDVGPDKEPATLFSTLSGPNHNVGPATSQFAINTQQGSACFCALNTVHTGAVAYIHSPSLTADEANDENEQVLPKPVLVVNCVTASGGVAAAVHDSNDNDSDKKGVTCHPRTLVIAGAHSRLSVVQSSVDLDVNDNSSDNSELHRPKLYNGYTQIFVQTAANVTHSCLEESGGIVTQGVEVIDADVPKGKPLPRVTEAARPELHDTHLEVVDVHVTGENGAYEGTMMNMGGSGRVRLAMSVALLKTGAHATVNGFSLSGGAQRADMKTCIHHIAQGTTSSQVQKNMIGGRSTGSFRGRIRVEQSAQQTDSKQLSRTILLSDKARAWAVPSLEIIADDVQCTHGATVSDLSEEELFYLRSRGLNRALARNLLMYAFAGDVSTCVDPAMLGAVDSQSGLQQRVIQRLENLVPVGERAVKGEFQSS